MSSYARRHNITIRDIYGDAEVPITEIQIERDCKVCFKGRETVVPEAEVMLVSPNGVVHEGEEFGMTSCGRDATGPYWWWRV